MFIDLETIRKFSNECFHIAGVPEKESNIITDVMLEADLREIHSHGVLRLPVYIQRLKKKLVKNKAIITNANETDAILQMNGNNSIGQIVAYQAIENSMLKAEGTGIGLVSVKNSNHFGIASYYSLMAAENNMIGIVLSNTAPLMPAVGGTDKVIGNNPISIASPLKDEYKIVLDMAISNTAFGKILDAKEKGENIPKDWGVNEKGLPTTDPNEILNGGLLSPVGGAKGFGLAFMIEILTGVLSGGKYSKMIPSMYDMTQNQSISYFMLTIDVKQLLSLDLYYESLDQLISYVKKSKKSANTEEIFLPGEIEFRKAKNNRTKGITINLQTYNNLKELGGELGTKATI
ncbi:Ldh family oxidoreductase [Virgibacillus natechei]|uniref:Ldh family oxidoreductase n=1 Tax=Virgibacillus sp. CBA3643 TaxID=2942278 RepID=UPI0035A38DA1